MEKGERVKVQTKSFKGIATILYIAPGEFYPVQVEMDSPDSDGHKIYRVASHEIVNEWPAENEMTATTETSADPEQLVGEVVQEVLGYFFKKGERFLLEKRKLESSVYYIYEQVTNKFRGCMALSMFEVLSPSSFQTLQEQSKPLQGAAKVEEKPVDLFVIPEEVRYEQMSLLDFI